MALKVSSEEIYIRISLQHDNISQTCLIFNDSIRKWKMAWKVRELQKNILLRHIFRNLILPWREGTYNRKLLHTKICFSINKKGYSFSIVRMYPVLTRAMNSWISFIEMILNFKEMRAKLPKILYILFYWYYWNSWLLNFAPENIGNGAFLLLFFSHSRRNSRLIKLLDTQNF